VLWRHAGGANRRALSELTFLEQAARSQSPIAAGWQVRRPAQLAPPVLYLAAPFVASDATSHAGRVEARWRESDGFGYPLRRNRARNMRPMRNAAIREETRVAVLKSSMRENIAARFRRVNFPYGRECLSFPIVGDL
jgi:hypothetical protein